jgi:hypothetical protein
VQEGDDKKKGDDAFAKKGGGKRKRRTAYSSGRREKLGFRRKSIINLRGEIKKALGTKSVKRKGGNTLSHTGYKSRQRWKTYESEGDPAPTLSERIAAFLS